MKFLTVTVLMGLTFGSQGVLANGNHEQNSHESYSDANVQATVGADAVASSSATATAGDAASTSSVGDVSVQSGEVTSNNSVDITNPDDIKLRNTPGVYSGAAEGNAGFGIAIPGFGFSVNAPVQKEDEKKMALAEQLWEMGAYAASRRVMCTTHRLEKALPDEIDCFESLGGDSAPVGK